MLMGFDLSVSNDVQGVAHRTERRFEKFDQVQGSLRELVIDLEEIDDGVAIGFREHQEPSIMVLDEFEVQTQIPDLAGDLVPIVVR